MHSCWTPLAIVYNTFWPATSLIPNISFYLLQHICSVNCCNPQSSRTFFGKRDSDARKTPTDEQPTHIIDKRRLGCGGYDPSPTRSMLGSRAALEHELVLMVCSRCFGHQTSELHLWRNFLDVNDVNALMVRSHRYGENIFATSESCREWHLMTLLWFYFCSPTGVRFS